VAILFGLWMRRRIIASRWIKDGQDTFPRVFKNPDTIDSPDSFTTFEHKQPLPTSVAASSTPTTMSTPQTSQSAFYPGNPGSVVPPPGIINHPWPLHHTHSSDFSSGSTPKHRENDIADSPVHLPLPNLPLPPITLKAIHPTDGDNIPQVQSSHHDISIQPHTAAAEVPPAEPTNTEPDIIIQRSSGGVVQELPPPYLDRSQKQLPSDPSISSETAGLAL